MKEIWKKWGLLGVVVAVGVAADQITKQWADAELRDAGIVPVIEGFFRLDYSRNPGAFFSLGADMSPGVRRIFFVVATLGAVLLITHLYRKSEPSHKALRWALALLLAGALGNLVDRAMSGEVIDFLHLHWQEAFHWATFNLADIYITIGLVLLVWDMIKPRKKVATTTKSAAS
jgi:signal peptidase II